MPLVLAGATSGSTTLTPVDAVTATITLPSATGTLAILGANTYTGAQVAPSIAFNSTSGVIGTTTNDAAAAGSVGEYVSSTVAPGSAVAVAVSTQANDITTISLTAGDWDVSINGLITSCGSASTRIFFWIGTTAGNSTAEATGGTTQDFIYALPNAGTISGSVPSFRVSLSSTTTYRFKAQATFTGTTPTLSGRISARRVR